MAAQQLVPKTDPKAWYAGFEHFFQNNPKRGDPTLTQGVMHAKGPTATDDDSVLAREPTDLREILERVARGQADVVPCESSRDALRLMPSHGVRAAPDLNQ